MEQHFPPLHYPDGSTQMPLPIDGMPERRQPTPEVIDHAREMLQDKLYEIKRINQGKHHDLLQMGASPAPAAILMARLETLIEVVLDEDSRIGFELGFEGRMHDILTECLVEVRQRKLLNGNGSPGNGLIVPG